MRRFLLIAFAAAFLDRPVAAQVCVATPIACGEVVRGTLGAGDCTRSDGTPYDTLQFVGAIDQYVRVVVYPTSPSMLRPNIRLLPPGSGAPPMIVAGGTGAALAYVLNLKGPWLIEVSASEAGAAGDYVIGVSCDASRSPWPGERDCIDQFMLCDQTAEGILTPESCGFSNSIRVFAPYSFYGVAGETIVVDLESSDFPPRIGIYDGGGHRSSPIARSPITSDTTTTLTFTLPETGLYDIVATARSDDGVRFGRFKMTMHGCRSSTGCLPPLIIQEPSDVAVPFGATARLTATALGIGPLHYVWSDRSTLPVPIFEGGTFITPRVTAPRWYSVTANTPCGTADSPVVMVTPAMPRHRPARR